MIPDLSIYNEALNAPGADAAHWRADWHDYHSKCIYMITLKKMPGIPDFSSIQGCMRNNRVEGWADHSRLGHILRRNFSNITQCFEEIKPLQFAIMPDHAHLLLEVRSHVSYHLGEMVRQYKKLCSGEYQTMLRREYNFEFDKSIFIDGYNDRILTGKNQLQTLYDYIRDNPRRLFLRKSYPQYFENALLCMAGQERFGIYGNISLLDHPNKVTVRFSRKYASSELRRHQAIWMETIRAGGVLVSPFIHPKEREYLKMALSRGGRVIYIMENGFHIRWKPSKSYIDATAAGRMLFVGPEEYHAAKSEMTRETACRLNALAANIAVLSPRAYSLRHHP